MKNYNSDWIYYQNETEDAVLSRYISDTNQKLSLQELKTSFEAKKHRTAELIRVHPAAYDAKMKNRYQSKVEQCGYGNGPYLYINDDQAAYDIQRLTMLK
ncbi:Hypothetical_protein [Hexamita inflata]|uniref:Hypothetical_protein n=1 Tax=Hexamita inflata TaxID=28002 RepID=A0AA86RQ60_9EUKA|nr:Hypothetical protein HINF_LOCUS66281 [Hexamita inflata]